MSRRVCKHCGQEISRILFMDVFPRWIHANGKMFCSKAPSEIATPR